MTLRNNSIGKDSFEKGRVSACGGSGDGVEFLRHQRRAADQAAVDVGLGEQLGGVGGLHAATIEDRQRAGDSSIVAGNFTTKERMDLLRLLRARSLAGPDRPDRLIGQDRAL